jgi:hypothetical protein
MKLADCDSGSDFRRLGTCAAPEKGSRGDCHRRSRHDKHCDDHVKRVCVGYLQETIAILSCQQRDGAEANQPHRSEHEEEAPSVEVKCAARQKHWRQRKWWRQHSRNRERAGAGCIEARLDALELRR